jgi:hypothetical protein
MMQHHLDENSPNVAEGAHAVLLLDTAGWHTTSKTSKINVPDNITPIFLPPCAPELMAISSAELALKHRLRKLRRDRRRRMRRSAKAHRSTLDRNVRLGSRRSAGMTLGIRTENVASVGKAHLDAARFLASLESCRAIVDDAVVLQKRTPITGKGQRP